MNVPEKLALPAACILLVCGAAAFAPSNCRSSGHSAIELASQSQAVTLPCVSDKAVEKELPDTEPAKSRERYLAQFRNTTQEVNARWNEFVANREAMDQLLRAIERLSTLESRITTPAFSKMVADIQLKRMQVVADRALENSNNGIRAKKEYDEAMFYLIDCRIKQSIQLQKPEKGGSNIRTLLADQIDASRSEFASRIKELRAGRSNLALTLDASERIARAESGPAANHKWTRESLEAHLRRLAEIQEVGTRQVKEMTQLPENLDYVRFKRIVCQIALARNAGIKDDAAIGRYLESQLSVVRAEWKERLARFDDGHGDLTALLDCRRRLYDAEIANGGSGNKVGVLAAYVTELQTIIAELRAKLDARRVASQSLAEAEFYLFEAESESR